MLPFASKSFTCNVQCNEHYGAELCDASDKYPADALRAHLQWLGYMCLECAFSLGYI